MFTSSEKGMVIIMREKPIHVTKSAMPPYEEYIEAIKPLWESHMMTNMGKNHKELESLLREYLKVQNLSLFVNGHLALELVLQAMNLSGEVITTPFTFASTTHAIVRNQLTPVFCDINEKDYTIDVNKIEKLITDRTTAILPVHVYGNICNTQEIDRLARKYDLKVIYDAAHAFGITVNGEGIGSFGDASMFSFHATKAFNTIEGGAISTADPLILNSLYKLKNFGFRNEVTVDGVGANAKMNEFQAIMGICNLKYFDDNVKMRKKVAERYRERLCGVPGLQVQCEDEDRNIKSNYTYFPLVVDEKIFGFSRNEIRDRLNEHNIFPRRYFYPLTSSFQCYKNQFDVNDTPVALKISKRVLTLPLYTDLELDIVDEICDIILKG